MTTKIDLCSEGLKEVARDKLWWDGQGEFNWSEVMGGGARGSLTSPDRRWVCGRNLLEEKSSGSQFTVVGAGFRRKRSPAVESFLRLVL